MCFHVSLCRYIASRGSVFVPDRETMVESSPITFKNGFSFKSWQHFQKWQNCVIHNPPNVVSLCLMPDWWDSGSTAWFTHSAHPRLPRVPLPSCVPPLSGQALRPTVRVHLPVIFVSTLSARSSVAHTRQEPTLETTLVLPDPLWAKIVTKMWQRRKKHTSQF